MIEELAVDEFHHAWINEKRRNIRLAKIIRGSVSKLQEAHMASNVKLKLGFLLVLAISATSFASTIRVGSSSL